MKVRILLLTLVSLLFVLAGTGTVFAAGGGEGDSSVGHVNADVFLWLAIILLLAMFSRLVEKLKQPAVLGELIIGVAVGSLVLFGISFFEPIKQSELIKTLAELGVVILLFQVGLESTISEMSKVGVRALGVALIGVVAPFGLGYLVSPMVLDVTQAERLFIAATLTATSVGITVRVLRDIGKDKTAEGKIIVGAAVFDDILGLIILSVVAGMATTGTVSTAGVGVIVAKAFGFLGIAIVAGLVLARPLSKFFSKINTGIGMKFTFAISLCLVFAYLADRVDLALIVGAFAAGLILEPIHFRYFQEPEIIEEIQKDLTNAPQSVRDKIADTIRQHADHHLNILIEPIAFLLVPIFFVVTGMQVDLSTLADPNILIAGVVITALAFIGKIAAGLFGGNNIHSMLVVGFGMIPRGEVALIFATIGKGLGVLSDEVFSVVIIMTILTTFPIPPILTYLLKMNKGSAIKVTEGSN